MASEDMARRFMLEPSLKKRGVRMAACGSFGGLDVCPVCGRKHVKGGHMCHDRMCPLCQWRLSATRFYQMLRCLEVLDDSLTECNADVGMLTLTLRNVPVYRIRDALKKMSEAWATMYHRPDFKNLVIGSARSFEITYNEKRKDYHPHIHIFLITYPLNDESRASLVSYITRWRNKVRLHRIEELKEKGIPIPENLKKPVLPPKFSNDKFLITEYARCSWQKALGIWYRPQVDYVKAYVKDEGRDAHISAYESISWLDNKEQARLSAARECAKYVIGMKTLSEIPDCDLYRFACEVAGVQMVGYTGILAKARKMFGYKDEKIDDDAERHNHDNKCPTCGSELQHYLLTWAGGYYKQEKL